MGAEKRMNLPRNFLETIASFKEKKKTLIQVADDYLTYEEFIQKIDHISRRLTYLGIKENDKVGIMVPNCTVWYTFFWAVVKIGACPVPIDPQSGLWELKHLINLTEMKVCMIVPKYRSNLIIEHMMEIKTALNRLHTVIVLEQEEIKLNQQGFLSLEDFMALPEGEKNINYTPDETHILSLACTSGSTGNPKILEVPYEGFYEALLDMSNYLGITKEDIMLIGMPLYHQGGFGMGLQTVLQGGTVIYEMQFNPENFLNIVETKKVTIIQLTTTLAKILISRSDFFERDFSSVKLCYFAGEVLPDEIAACFYEKLGIRVVNIIGSSETATMVAWDSKKDLAVDCNTFKELPFTKVKVLNESDLEVAEGEIGELAVYTTGVIKGYYKNEEENKRHFCEVGGTRYFKTGDMVKKETKQHIRFVGRYKRIIKRGANLVYAEEVENFLLTHPDIEAVAVTKQADEVLGEAIIAYLQTKDHKALTRGDILKFSKGKLSAYKIPDQIKVVDEVPHDIGKIQFKYINVEEGDHE